MADTDAAQQWSAAEAEALYAMETWGDGFFHVNDEGHVAVRPRPDGKLSIDIPSVIAAAQAEGVTMPMIIRFQDVLRVRVRRLNEAFTQAIEESGYSNRYQGVYPIKVNQLHEVVDEVFDAGEDFGLGLECGSKSELVATLPLVGDQRLLLCNGVKDHVMLSLMLNAQALGQHVLPVIEKYSEFDQLMILADERGVVPRMALRMKLSTRGSGRWFESGGYRSKFGLTVPELMRVVQDLESRGMTDRLELLHFHLGSQISNIQVLRSAVKEITQMYADLRHRGLDIKYLDVGGGLGVNYGGGYAGADETAVNYALTEYANAVVYSVQEICKAREVPEPVLVSESGRALTAHHSVLVVPALGVHRPDAPFEFELGDDPAPVVAAMARTLAEAREAAEFQPLLEAFHDAQEGRTEADQLMRLGYLDVESLARTDSLYWSTCREVLSGLQALELSPPPPEQAQLEDQLTDLYLCDFSVFHSIIDHWAIGQMFPVMPLHRLDEEPRRRAQVVDLTCDSDGKVAHYPRAGGVSEWLPLHKLVPGEPYYLGFFLVGAYQEILGDSHNLFGRVSEVHVYASDDEPGNFFIEKVIGGITVQDMLAQVQYFPNELNKRMSDLVKAKIEAGVVKPNEGMRILNQYTRRFEETTYCDMKVLKRE
ncbi:MAG: biosynthetic arginine decarboxylase [Gammaproteobacteria bacterium]|jgi:arginine decarboxylase|nr:biosynthetic arginine decarboxylase [Gammaproteobacteria bacterium]